MFRSNRGDPEIHFVGGYRIEEELPEYPDIHFSHNEDWEVREPLAPCGRLHSILTARRMCAMLMSSFGQT